jgi:hypothetical protein
MVGLQNASHHDAVQPLQMKAVGVLFVVGCKEKAWTGTKMGKWHGTRLGQLRRRSGKETVRRHVRNGCLHRQFFPRRQRCGIKSSNAVELLGR